MAEALEEIEFILNSVPTGLGIAPSVGYGEALVAWPSALGVVGPGPLRC